MRFLTILIMSVSSLIYPDNWNEVVHFANQNKFIRSVCSPKSVKFKKLRRNIDLPIDNQSHTLLYYAIGASDFDLAQLLIERGANLKPICDDLIMLCLERESKGDFKIFEFAKKQAEKEGKKTTHDLENLWLKFVFNRNFYYLKPEKKIKKESPLIPKIIHQIWIGPNPVPEEFKWMMESWQKMNPSWVYKLWTNKDLETFSFVNQKAFDSAINWGMKSDILRCEILDRFGGVYVDIDFECLKSLDTLHHLYDFYCCIVPDTNECFVANGLIGAKPGHPIIKSCLEKWNSFGSFHSFSTNNVFEIMTLTGPYFLTYRVIEYFTSGDNAIRNSIVLPSHYFFPFPYQDRLKYWKKTCSREEILKKWYSPESLAIHYWAMSWTDVSEVGPN